MAAWRIRVIGERSTKKKIWFYFFLLIWCVQMLTAAYFCCHKQGFHEDEYYSYYSTARTYGLSIEDETWMEHDTYYNEFVVLAGERFRYGLVKLVQSWDVHPPVYYWILHTVCSLFPGQFSKWFGLSVNLAAFGASMFLLRFLALQVTRRKEELSFLVCFFYGFTPAVMSSVVFIRMYALLSMFVLLCAVLHVQALKDYEEGGKLSVRKFLLPAAIVTYLGFLTQYYYFIFLFFLAAAFCVRLLWRDKNLWNCIRYGISLAIAFLCAYLTYPSCLGQMFRGQRGAQATGNFFDLSNTFTRLFFFWDILNEAVFGKMLPVFLALILALLFCAVVKKRFSLKECGRNTAYWILLFAVLGYFFTVSKTALLLGNTSVRYQTPVYGMVVLLVFATVEYLGRVCMEIDGAGIEKNGAEYEAGQCRQYRKNRNWLLAAAIVICCLMNTVGLLSGWVVFLYPEDAEHIAFAREKAEKNTPVVYIYDTGASWCVWDSADEFFEYDGIYFANQNDTEPITDPVVAGSKDLIVYLSNTAQEKEQLQRIMESNPNLTAYELRYREKYCDVYYFQDN